MQTARFTTELAAQLKKCNRECLHGLGSHKFPSMSSGSSHTSVKTSDPRWPTRDHLQVPQHHFAAPNSIQLRSDSPQSLPNDLCMDDFSLVFALTLSWCTLDPQIIRPVHTIPLKWRKGQKLRHHQHTRTMQQVFHNLGCKLVLL